MIEVFNSYIVIRNIDKNCTQDDVDKLFHMFSAFDKVAHKNYLETYVRFGNDVYIPGTIDSKLIQFIFPFKKLITHEDSYYIKHIEYNMKTDYRDDLQKNAANFLLSIKKDSEIPHRMLNLKTGSGKTFVSIKFISMMKMRSIIIVDTSELANQRKMQFMKHSDIKEEEIHILSGMDAVENANDEKYKIFIALHKTLNMMIAEDPNSLNVLFKKLKIGIRIFDEAHTNFKNMCQILDVSDIRYNIYLTATPDRSAISEKKLYQFIFDKVPKFTQLGFENYINIIFGHIDSRPTINQIVHVKTKYGFSIPIRANYITEKRYKYILSSVLTVIKTLKLNERNKKVAIMLPTLNLINKLAEDVYRQYPEISIGIFTGEVAKDKRRGELEKQFIFTNDKIFDKGIDIPDLEVLINYVPLQSRSKIEQIMGRIRNIQGLTHLYVDIADYGFPDCRRQQKSRISFYKKKANKILELTKELANFDEELK